MNDKYNIILADPPWNYKDHASADDRGAIYKYNMLSQASLCRLPVRDIVADDAVLFLWCTFPMILEAIEVVTAWGFKYKTLGFIWVKQTKLGKPWHWGMGNWTRSNSEPCLIGVRGKLRRIHKGIHQVVCSPVKRHSEKPTEVHDRIVQLMGDLPRVELFARQKMPGWDAWGDQLKGSKKLFPRWKVYG